MKRYAWVIAVLFFTLLTICGSRMHTPWDDEAETLLFGQSILSHGVPYGWDGVNIMGFNDAVVLNQNLVNHVSPWPQYYLAALGTLLFGHSFAAISLLFLLFGVASILVLYKAIYELTGQKKYAAAAVIAASLNVEYIMFAYQIRYYPILMFFAALWLWGTVRLFQKKSRAILILLAAGIGGIYTHYAAFTFYVVAVGAGILLWILVVKKRPWRLLLPYAGAVASAGIVFAPWYFLFKPAVTEVAAFVPQQALTGSTIDSLLSALSMANGTNVLPYLLLAAAAGMVVYRVVRKKSVSLYAFVGGAITAYFLVVAVGDAMTTSVSTFVAFRYQVVMFPVFMAFTGAVIADLWDMHWIAGILACIIFLLTNLGTISPVHVFLYDYVHELVSPPPQPDVMVAAYLSAHAKTGDTALASLDRDYEPLMFLLGKKIRFVNRVSLTNTRLFPTNRSLLPRYVYDFTSEPDWVILYSQLTPDGSYFFTESNDVPGFINLSRDYDLTVLPVFFSDMSRPELFWHTFYAIAPTTEEQVFVYHKKP